MTSALADVRTTERCLHWHFTAPCISSGGARAVKEPGHSEIRKSSSQVTWSHGRSQHFTLGTTESERWGIGLTRVFSGVYFFSSKKLTTFLVVALKIQAANAADCFTVKIKQIKRSDTATFLFFCSHYYRSKAIGRAEPGRCIVQPGHWTWCALVPPVWGRGTPLFPLCPYTSSSFPLYTFLFLSLALLIFFFCPSFPFLPE